MHACVQRPLRPLYLIPCLHGEQAMHARAGQEALIAGLWCVVMQCQQEALLPEFV